MTLPRVNTTIEYVPFKGGFDSKTPSIEKSPGLLDVCKNYVPDTDGGYSRIDGYERFSGQPAPSAAVYYYVAMTITGTIAVGDTITGVDSSETAEVIVVGTGYINITKMSGTFSLEVVNIGGAPVGTITVLPALSGESTMLLSATATGLAADVYRADISAPAGSGAILGVGVLKGTVYCFRNNAGGTAAALFKESAAGWAEVTLYHELSFDTGIATIADGTAITQLTSGATAVVKRTVWESGTWTGSNAVGRLILGTIVGTFDNTHDIQVSGATVVTSTSAATQITIGASGRYEIIETNFFGSLDTKRLYGCDGVNRGFEFDGTVYVPLDTGMPTDTPEYVEVFKKQLFFSFKGSSQNSGIGYPYKWTAVSGALEIAVGDDISGYIQLPGQTLAILARNLTDQLIGQSVADYVLDSISSEIGCIPRTVQRLGYAFCLDDRGIINIYPTDKTGNFEQNTISRKIQAEINLMRGVVTASAVYRTKNQYRLYGSDGTGICMTLLDSGYAFGKFVYPDYVNCTASSEDSTGKDVVFWGSAAGMVYQADKGSSFDGDAIEAFAGLPYNHSKSPSTIKSYKRAIIEMTSESYSSISYFPSFSYGNTDISQHISKTITTGTPGGYWDVDNWDTFYYDGTVVDRPSIPIFGNGLNMALTFYSSSTIDLGHRIDGMTLHYITRRSIR